MLYRSCFRRSFDGGSVQGHRWKSRAVPRLPRFQRSAIRGSIQAEATGRQKHRCRVCYVSNLFTAAVPEQCWYDPRPLEACPHILTARDVVGANHTTLYRIGTPGAYRDDSTYLEQCAQRIAVLQRVAFSEGMNCYVSRATYPLAISRSLQIFLLQISAGG